MRTLLVLLAVLAAGTAGADTLDYGNLTAAVTLPGAKAFGSEANAQLLVRARALLRAAAFDRDYTVGDFLSSHDKAARRLDRMTLEYRRGDVRFTSDGSSEADYVFPLTGAVMELLLPTPGPRRLLGRVACPCCGREWPAEREVPADLELVPFETGDEPAHTGVLVDVRGLEFSPALFPRVVTEEGVEVFGPAFAEEDAVVAEGLAGYYRNRNGALQAARVGSNPLVVRAVGVEGRNRCEAVVSARDAARIHGTKLSLGNLARCRVGFLTD
ncbi:MAG: hypothetical protein R6X12_03950 [bacterium]